MVATTGLLAPSSNSSADLSSWLGNQYTGLLGRAPDATGLNYWLGQMQGGRGYQDVYNSFYNSPEALNYRNQSGTNTNQLGGRPAPLPVLNSIGGTPSGGGPATTPTTNTTQTSLTPQQRTGTGEQNPWVPPRGTTERLSNNARFVLPSSSMPTYLNENAWHTTNPATSWGDTAPKGWNPSVNQQQYFPWMAPSGDNNTVRGGPYGIVNPNGVSFPRNNEALNPIYRAPDSPNGFRTLQEQTPGTGAPGTPGVRVPGETVRQNGTTTGTGTTPGTGNTTPGNTGRPPQLITTQNPADDRPLTYQPPAGGQPNTVVDANVYGGRSNDMPLWFERSVFNTALSDLRNAGLIDDPFAAYQGADGQWRYPVYTEAEYDQIAQNLWKSPAFQERWGTDPRTRATDSALLTRLGLSPFWAAQQAQAQQGMPPMSNEQAPQVNTPNVSTPLTTQQAPQQAPQLDAEAQYRRQVDDSLGALLWRNNNPGQPLPESFYARPVDAMTQANQTVQQLGNQQNLSQEQRDQLRQAQINEVFYENQRNGNQMLDSTAAALVLDARSNPQVQQAIMDKYGMTVEQYLASGQAGVGSARQQEVAALLNGNLNTQFGELSDFDRANFQHRALYGRGIME